MKRKIYMPLLSAGMLGFAIYHVVNAGQQPTKPAPLIDPPSTPFTSTLAASGVVEPVTENIAVGSPLPGVVDEVFVRVGDGVRGPSWFTRGTPLFRLDERQMRAEARVRQAALAATEANLARLEAMPRPEEVPPSRARVREAKANLEDLRDLLQRSTKLYAERAVGEEEVSHRRQAFQSGQAQLERAEAELELLMKGAWAADKAVSRVAVEQSRAMLQQTFTELDRLTVRAPVDGQVLQRNVRPGEFVGATAGPALLVVGDARTLHVRADIDENDIPYFKPGLEGAAAVRGAPREQRPLKFVRVEPYVIPKRALTGASTERVDTRVLQVIFAVGPGEVPLFVGQQVDVFLRK